MKKLAAMFPLIFAFLNINMEDKLNAKETLELSAEDKVKLDAAAKIEGFAEKFMTDYNTALASEDTDKALKLVSAYMKEVQAEDSDAEKATGKEDASEKSASTDVEKLISRQTKMEAEMKVIRTENEKMAKKPETDESVEIIKGSAMKNSKIAHSKTHLFASNDVWNEFAGRPWNEAARQAMAGETITAATNWTETANIDKLNSDIQAYFRKDPMLIHTTLLDGLQMKKYVELVSGVSDEYVYTTIATGEITQTLKSTFLPKNKAKFEAEIGKVRDIQIDMLFKGYELKKLEKAYLKNIAALGITDSNPHKMQYVNYVVTEIMKRARKEDKIVMGRGVYFSDPNRTTPASFMNNFDGFIKLILRARGTKYNPFIVGKPTSQNIYDYINTMCELLPHDVKILPELQYVISPFWKRKYNEARKNIYGGNTNYTGDTDTVDNFANIELVTYDQLEGEDLMYITTKDNEYSLTDKPGEDGFIQFQKGGEDPRDIKAFGDYKLGTFIAVFGRKQLDLAADSFENQLFFSNDVEALTTTYVPVAADDATPSLAVHNSLVIGSNNTQATNITTFDDATVGSRVYVTGNQDTLVSTVKNNANIILASGDFALTNGSLLVLQALAGGKFIEISRKVAGATVAAVQIALAADATTADAADGTSFVTVANTVATAITDIVNAVVGEQYTITGGSATNATTIASAGNFFLSAAITLNLGVYITVEFNGSKFIEVARG
jgi:hypothetical protein